MMTAAATRMREATGGSLTRSARGILEAMEQRDCTSFERELERAISFAPERSSYAEERRELLEAVAGDLRTSVKRLVRGAAPGLGAVHADLRLLTHLSRLPAIG